MEERDKLLEAARMIYDNCVKHAVGKPCIFADGGTCKGTENCSIGNEIKLPYDWRITKPCRWTEKDYNLAKALVSFGVNQVCKLMYENYVVHGGKSGILSCLNGLPDGVFLNLEPDETIKLQDIIAEYEKCNGSN